MKKLVMMSPVPLIPRDGTGRDGFFQRTTGLQPPCRLTSADINAAKADVAPVASAKSSGASTSTFSPPPVKQAVDDIRIVATEGEDLDPSLLEIFKKIHRYYIKYENRINQDSKSDYNVKEEALEEDEYRDDKKHFKCILCPKSFVHAQGLSKHKANVHLFTYKQHPCPHCECVCKSKSEIFSHIKHIRKGEKQ